MPEADTGPGDGGPASEGALHEACPVWAPYQVPDVLDHHVNQQVPSEERSAKATDDPSADGATLTVEGPEDGAGVNVSDGSAACRLAASTDPWPAGSTCWSVASAPARLCWAWEVSAAAATLAGEGEDCPVVRVDFTTTSTRSAVITRLATTTSMDSPSSPSGRRPLPCTSPALSTPRSRPPVTGLPSTRTDPHHRVLPCVNATVRSMSRRAPHPDRFGGIGLWLQPPEEAGHAEAGGLLEAAAAAVGVAERAGIGSVWVSESPAPVGAATPFEAYSLLGALAVRSDRVRLGTVADGAERRAPSILAKIVTGVDVISTGERCWRSTGTAPPSRTPSACPRRSP